MRAVVSLAIKDLRLLWRDKLGLFWVILFPLLIALFFGSIFGGEGGGARSMKVALIRETGSGVAQKFYDELAKATVLDTYIMSRDSARTLVQRGKLTAYVEYTGEGESSFDLFAKPGNIVVGIDPSRKAEAGYLNGMISQAYFMVLQSAMTNTKGWKEQLSAQRASMDSSLGMSSGHRNNLIKLFDALDSLQTDIDAVNSTGTDSAKASGGMSGPKIDFTDVAVNTAHPRTAFEITFPQSLQWALVGTAATFGLSIVTERRRGTWMRLRLAPLSRAHILAGKGLACFIACFSVCLLLMGIGVFMFGVQIGSVPWLIAALASAAFCFVGLMMLMSVLGKTEASVSGAGWALFLVLSMTGGGMVPLMVMPSWMVTVSHFSPVKWSILATEGASWRGFGASEMMLPIIVLLSVGAVGYLIGVLVLRRSDG